MQTLHCFVIIPSNRGDNKDEPITLIKDDKHGWIELPSKCRAKKGAETITVDFNTTYSHIVSPAIETINKNNADIHIEYIRGQDITEPGDIVDQVTRRICEADITITDITSQNPNVFLELGIRLSLKDSLNILIAHAGVESPFNIKMQRYIPYTDNMVDADKAKEGIVEAIQSHLDKSDDKSQLIFYKRYVEIYSGRILEHNLMRVFDRTPKLVADFLQFLYVNGTKLYLRDKSFEFLETVKDVLKNDPAGQERAIEHLEMISNIEGLDKTRRQQIYLELGKLCDTNDTLKEKAERYRREAEKLEV